MNHLSSKFAARSSASPIATSSLNCAWVICGATHKCVDVHAWIDQVQWAIVDGESGMNARPLKSSWVRYLRDQC